MSFFGKVDKSTTGAVIKKVARHTRPSKSIDSSPLQPGRGQRELRRLISTKTAPAPAFSFADWFIGALVSAGHCDKHTPPPRSPTHSSRRLRHIQSPQSRGVVSHSFFSARRSQHTEACHTPPTQLLSPEELHGLVDSYDTPYNAAQFEKEVYEIAPGPQLVVSDRPDDVAWPPKEDQWPATEPVADILKQLYGALKKMSRDPEEMYDMYRLLPSPRAPYLTSRLRHRLLRHLGKVKRKDASSMLRYLSVIDDMKAHSIPLSVEEWNVALSYVATYTKRISATDMEGALQMFKEMENVAGVQGDCATFNILFDAATKAGKLSLAEMIHKEMESRGIKYNRFHHVSLIFHFGLKEDGEGVRKAYKAMVDSGEIIDTVALNAVMAALIRAREPQAAMQVYRRMVRAFESFEDSPKLPILDWRKKRRIDRSLVSLARLHRESPQLSDRDKETRIIAPDAHTYTILANFHAVQAGHLHTVTKLLDEMAWFGLPMQGSIFLALFRGFAKHGAELYSNWTAARLESVWKAFKEASASQVVSTVASAAASSEKKTDDKEINVVSANRFKGENVYMGKWIAIWVLQAFGKVSGPDRAREIWEEIEHLSGWEPTDDEMDHVRKILHEITEKNNGL